MNKRVAEDSPSSSQHGASSGCRHRQLLSMQASRK